MSKNKHNKKFTEQQTEQQTDTLNGDAQESTTQDTQGDKKINFIRLYISIGCFAVGVILFILSFVIKGGNAGVYLLISSMIAELAAVTFTNAQKRISETVLVKVFRYLSYAVMIAGLIVFVIGTGMSTTKK